MSKVNWHTELSDIIEQNTNCLYNICKLCITLFDNNKETAQEGFRYFLTECSPPSYTLDEIPDTLLEVDETEIDANTQNRIGDMEYHLVNELISKDVSEDTFYEEMWKRISDTFLVPDIYQRSFFLYKIWLNPKIPYFQLGSGVEMDNDAYREYVNRLRLPYKKMLFAMNVGYPQKTQRASVLLKIFDEITDPNERIVFWCLTLGRLENIIVTLKNKLEGLTTLTEFSEEESE